MGGGSSHTEIAPRIVLFNKLGTGSTIGNVTVNAEVVEGTAYTNVLSDYGSGGFVYFQEPKDITITASSGAGRWMAFHPDGTYTSAPSGPSNYDIDNVIFLINTKSTGSSMGIKIVYR